jgi:hypothetical protein
MFLKKLVDQRDCIASILGSIIVVANGVAVNKVMLYGGQFVVSWFGRTNCQFLEYLSRVCGDHLGSKFAG